MWGVRGWGPTENLSTLIQGEMKEGRVKEDRFQRYVDQAQEFCQFFWMWEREKRRRSLDFCMDDYIGGDFIQ